MKYWEWCEKEVLKMTGGKATPASGARRIKGDVRLYDAGWYIEVKSTEKESYGTLYRHWFETLEKVDGLDVCLVYWFGDKTGGCYFFEKTDEFKGETWSSLKVLNGKLPAKLPSPNGIWTLEPLDVLSELKG